MSGILSRHPHSYNLHLPSVIPVSKSWPSWGAGVRLGFTRGSALKAVRACEEILTVLLLLKFDLSSLLVLIRCICLTLNTSICSHLHPHLNPLLKGQAAKQRACSPERKLGRRLRSPAEALRWQMRSWKTGCSEETGSSDLVAVKDAGPLEPPHLWVGRGETVWALARGICLSRVVIPGWLCSSLL